MSPVLNAHEHKARIRKVNAIVRVLDASGVSAYEAERYTPEEQATVARMARVNVASPDSWRAVVARLDTVAADPLPDEVCVFCQTDGCDDTEHGAPCHRLCAEEASYRRAQEDQLSQEMSL